MTKGKSVVRFVDAWTVAGLWFGMDVVMKLAGESMPNWLRYEVDLKADFMLAVFLSWLWVAYRKCLNGEQER